MNLQNKKIGDNQLQFLVNEFENNQVKNFLLINLFHIFIFTKDND